jgi:hypothetical protein
MSGFVFVCNIISMFISRRIIWVGQIVSMGENRNAWRFVMGTPEVIMLL